MRVETVAIDGTYDELVDAAEDLDGILSAHASNLVDLTPSVEHWLVAQLEQIELALARRLDGDDPASQSASSTAGSAAAAEARSSA